MLKGEKIHVGVTDFGQKLNQEQRVTRKIMVTDELFKEIKLLAFNTDRSLYALLNETLKTNLENKAMLKTNNPDYHGSYKNFAINTLLFKQVKQYCIENSLSLKAFLHNSLINIVRR